MKLKTPYADWLPPLSTSEFNALRASIQHEGIKHPVEATEDYRVLDGHHRLRVREDAPVHVVPGSGEWDDDECAAYLFRANFHRRSLSPEQRREQIKTAGKAALRLFRRDECRFTQEQIGFLFGVCQQTVSRWLETITHESNSFQSEMELIPDSRVKVPKPHWPVITERVEAGEPAAKVAADYGVTKQAINKGIATYKKKSRKKEEHVPEGNPRIVNDLQTLIGNGESFGTLYADPPWRYDNQGTRASTDNHYHTMTVEEIASLPVASLAATESHLFLWTTWSFLFDCPAIMEAWGFNYKTGAVWCKPQIGIGNYFRKSTEILLFASRGGLQFIEPVPEKDWFVHDRLGHSQKPEMFRKIIEQVSPGPYLELFGRQLADGWTVFGNQVEKTMFDTDAVEV